MAEVLIEDTKLARLSAAAKHDEQIIEMERFVTRLKGEWEQAKDASLAAKKAYDKAVNELREKISEGPAPQMGLFDGAATAKPALRIAGLTEGVESDLVDDEEEDPLARSIDCLNMPQAQKDKLREIGVFSVGQANEFRLGNVKGYEKGAASIPGWGAGKVKKFEDALLAVLPEQGETDELSDEVDTVEASVAEPVAEEPVQDDNTRRVRLTADVDGMQEVGLVFGAEFDATLTDNIVTITVDDTPYILEPGEFEYVGLVESA